MLTRLTQKVEVRVSTAHNLGPANTAKVIRALNLVKEVITKKIANLSDKLEIPTIFEDVVAVSRYGPNTYIMIHAPPNDSILNSILAHFGVSHEFPRLRSTLSAHDLLEGTQLDGLKAYDPRSKTPK